MSLDNKPTPSDQPKKRGPFGRSLLFWVVLTVFFSFQTCALGNLFASAAIGGFILSILWVEGELKWK